MPHARRRALPHLRGGSELLWPKVHEVIILVLANQDHFGNWSYGLNIVRCCSVTPTLPRMTSPLGKALISMGFLGSSTSFFGVRTSYVRMKSASGAKRPFGWSAKEKLTHKRHAAPLSFDHVVSKREHTRRRSSSTCILAVLRVTTSSYLVGACT